jgi:hypothetical protein
LNFGARSGEQVIETLPRHLQPPRHLRHRQSLRAAGVDLARNPRVDPLERAGRSSRSIPSRFNT